MLISDHTGNSREEIFGKAHRLKVHVRGWIQQIDDKAISLHILAPISSKNQNQNRSQKRKRKKSLKIAPKNTEKEKYQI